MTVTTDGHRGDHPREAGEFTAGPRRRRAAPGRPVEFWTTAAIADALASDDLPVWQQITAAIKRDPYGRTARQVEEALAASSSYGVSTAMAEVLTRTRADLESAEHAEIAEQVAGLLARSGLGAREFASRIGVPAEKFAGHLEGTDCPSAALLLRMTRLADRFARMRADS